MSLEDIKKRFEEYTQFPSLDRMKYEAEIQVGEDFEKLIAVAEAAVRLKDECGDLNPGPEEREKMLEALAALEKE